MPLQYRQVQETTITGNPAATQRVQVQAEVVSTTPTTAVGRTRVVCAADQRKENAAERVTLFANTLEDLYFWCNVRS